MDIFYISLYINCKNFGFFEMGRKKNIHCDLVWYKRIVFEILWGTCYIFGLMPRWFRYGIMHSFFTAILRLLGYRKRVILENLRKSFPEKSESEIKHIMREYYRTLSEVIVTTISLAAATPKRFCDAIEWVEPEQHIEKNKGRDWIAMASHYGCWEYYPLWCWQDKLGYFMAVYHPLKSDIFEHFYRRLRSFEPNVAVVPMKETVRHYIKHRSSEHTTVLGLISDQSPRLTAESQWIDFLNQKTIFIEGSERLAMKFKIPVYFVVTERICLGRYRISFIEIYDGKEPIKEGDITRRYAEELEKMIRRTPELWMWSHKRWKHTPEKQAAKFGASTLK